MDFDIGDHSKKSPYAISLVADTYTRSNHRSSFPQMPNIVRYSDIMPGLPDMIGKTEDGYSIIEKLMASKKNQERLLQNKQEHLQQQTNYFPLQATEKKIFNEVINLSEDIKPIQDAIKAQKNRILELKTEIQHISIPIKSSRTIKQLQIQNDKLNNILLKLKAEREGGLTAKLRKIQHQYEQLKEEFLSLSKDPINDQQLLKVRQINEDLKVRIEALHKRSTFNKNQNILESSRQFKKLMQQEKEKKQFLEQLGIHRNQQLRLIQQNNLLQEILTKTNNKEPLGAQASKYISENIFPKQYKQAVIPNNKKTEDKINNSNILNQLQTSSRGLQRKTKKQNSNISYNQNNQYGYISNSKKQQWRKQMNTSRLGQYADIVSAFQNILEN